MDNSFLYMSEKTSASLYTSPHKTRSYTQIKLRTTAVCLVIQYSTVHCSIIHIKAQVATQFLFKITLS